MNAFLLELLGRANAFPRASLFDVDAIRPVAVLVVQLVLGPAMVLARLPLPLATAHNAVAALLLLATVALLRSVSAPATLDARR